MTQQSEKLNPRYGIMESPQTINPKKGELLMNMITQKAKKRQAVVKLAKRKGKSHASRIYVEREEVVQAI
jgi:hypothetical protein